MVDALPAAMQRQRDRRALMVQRKLISIAHYETRNLSILGTSLVDIGTKLSTNRVQTLETLQSPDNLRQTSTELRNLAARCEFFAEGLDINAERSAALRAQIPQTVSFFQLPLELRDSVYHYMGAEIHISHLVRPRVELDSIPALRRHPVTSIIQTCSRAQSDLVRTIMRLGSSFVIQVTTDDPSARNTWIHPTYLAWFEDGQKGNRIKTLDLLIGGPYDDVFRIIVEEHLGSSVKHARTP